jgi:hypothetical protein
MVNLEESLRNLIRDNDFISFKKLIEEKISKKELDINKPKNEFGLRWYFLNKPKIGNLEMVQFHIILIVNVNGYKTFFYDFDNIFGAFEDWKTKFTELKYGIILPYYEVI